MVSTKMIKQRVTAYHPMGNGIAEALNQILNRWMPG